MASKVFQLPREAHPDFAVPNRKPIGPVKLAEVNTEHMIQCQLYRPDLRDLSPFQWHLNGGSQIGGELVADHRVCAVGDDIKTLDVARPANQQSGVFAFDVEVTTASTIDHIFRHGPTRIMEVTKSAGTNGVRFFKDNSGEDAIFDFADNTWVLSKRLVYVVRWSNGMGDCELWRSDGYYEKVVDAVPGSAANPATTVMNTCDFAGKLYSLMIWDDELTAGFCQKLVMDLYGTTLEPAFPMQGFVPAAASTTKVFQLPREMHPDFAVKNQQPVGQVKIRKSHPLADDLKFLILHRANSVEVVSNQPQATAAAEVTYGVDGNGQYVKFDTYIGDGYVETPVPDVANWSGVTCISQFIFTSSLSGFPGLITSLPNVALAGNYNLGIGETNSGEVEWRAGNATTRLASTNSRANGELTFVAGTWDKANLNLYVQQESENSLAVTGPTAQTTDFLGATAVENYIGYYTRGGGRSMIDPIYVSMVFNRALDQSEIESIRDDLYGLLEPAVPMQGFVPEAASTTKVYQLPKEAHPDFAALNKKPAGPSYLNSNHFLYNDLTGYWLFNEQWGYRNLVNGVEATPGSAGAPLSVLEGEYKLDCVADTSNIDTGLVIGTEVSAFFRVTRNIGGTDNMYFCGNINGSGPIELAYNASNDLIWFAHTNDWVGAPNYTATTFVDGETAFLGFSYDETAGMRIYKNGVEILNESTSGALSLTANNWHWGMRGDNDAFDSGSQFAFGGVVNRPMSAAEHMQLYRDQYGILEPAFPMQGFVAAGAVVNTTITVPLGPVW